MLKKLKKCRDERKEKKTNFKKKRKEKMKETTYLGEELKVS